MQLQVHPIARDNELFRVLPGGLSARDEEAAGRARQGCPVAALLPLGQTYCLVVGGDAVNTEVVHAMSMSVVAILEHGCSFPRGKNLCDVLLPVLTS